MPEGITASQAADLLRQKYDLPRFEPPVATLARGLSSRDGSTVEVDGGLVIPALSITGTVNPTPLAGDPTVATVATTGNVEKGDVYVAGVLAPGTNANEVALTGFAAHASHPDTDINFTGGNIVGLIGVGTPSGLYGTAFGSTSGKLRAQCRTILTGSPIWWEGGDLHVASETNTSRAYGNLYARISSVTTVTVASGNNPLFTLPVGSYYHAGQSITISGMASGAAVANGTWVISEAPTDTTFRVGTALTTTTTGSGTATPIIDGKLWVRANFFQNTNGSTLDAATANGQTGEAQIYMSGEESEGTASMGFAGCKSYVRLAKASVPQGAWNWTVNSGMLWVTVQKARGCILNTNGSDPAVGATFLQADDWQDDTGDTLPVIYLDGGYNVVRAGRWKAVTSDGINILAGTLRFSGVLDMSAVAVSNPVTLGAGTLFFDGNPTLIAATGRDSVLSDGTPRSLTGHFVANTLAGSDITARHGYTLDNGTYVVELPPMIGVASLPAASAALNGATATVHDANATTVGSTAAAGGANRVGVRCNGSVWKIVG